MPQPEAASGLAHPPAWLWPPSDYAIRWITLGVVTALTSLGFTAYGITVDSRSSLPFVLSVLMLLSFLVPLQLAARAFPILLSLVRYLTDFVLSFTQLGSVLFVFGAVSYLAARVGAEMPLLDAGLSWLDAVVFGFHWDAVAGWTAEHPNLERLLSTIYFSLPAQGVALLACGSLFRPNRRNARLIWLVIISASLTTAVFVLTPALGRGGHLGPLQQDALNAIRSGRWTRFVWEDVGGIVNFPSFHTALAVIFVHVAGHLHKLLPLVFIPLNTAMLMSISPIGGHYLTDILGGIAVALFSIAVVAGGVARPRPSST